MPPRVPVVFISSTCEDLKDYRLAARDAALNEGFLPDMREYFTPGGGRPPVEECLEQVARADVVVAICARRYGWKPPGRDGNSITWLECLHARDVRGIDVIPMVLEEGAVWPPEHEEEYRLTAALKEGKLTPEMPADVMESVARLKEFRAWLSGLGVRGTFTNRDQLQGQVERALRRWRDRHPEFAAAKTDGDPRRYLAHLREQTGTIGIRGLQVGSGKAYRFPIDQLYIPLTTASLAGRGTPGPERAPVGLETALRHERLVIVGDPGSGKTTFLRRIAFELANHALLAGASPAKAGEGQEPGLLSRLPAIFRPKPKSAAASIDQIPLFLRIAELGEHLRAHTGHPGAPGGNAPEWIIHFLSKKTEETNCRLDAEYVRRLLDDGSAVVLLDGLDEAATATERARIARIFEEATRSYPRCRWVVTTRPQAYTGTAMLAGFEEARIEPLDQKAVAGFLDHWCRALFPENPGEAARHMAGLTEALHARPEIRLMTATPVMLTALAVVHWNDKRIPEQRADLYESILGWLARAREERPGRATPERCLDLLRVLALSMQDDPRGRRTEIDFGAAADILAGPLEGPARAEQFLQDEEVDSGIIVRRDTRLRFWHLTFQEYCAARALAGRGEAEQQRVLIESGKLYKPEWRECALLFAGVLRGRQGAEKVDGFFSAVLASLGGRPTLGERARAAGLLGAMVRDLQPYHYQPQDPRYKDVVDSVLGVFDATSVGRIDFQTRLEAAEALGQAGDPRLGKDKHENWIRIESFEIARFPVMVAEYRQFVEDAGHRVPNEWEGQKQHPNWPVTRVSWHDAVAYCQWAGLRLPTEREWERAAQAAEGREYPWGNERPDPNRANYDESKVGDPTPVGLYPLGATPEGIRDLAGNVWEWCADWYDEKKEYKVLRGGSWNVDSVVLRAAYRYGLHPGNWYDDVGFRCVRD
jgi:hypothetical protein